MGALFQIRAAVFDPFETYREQYPAHNLYCLMTDGTTALPETHFSPPFGLVFGNESSGLAPNFHTLGVSVFIPQNPAIDSLNLAVSVGITLYQAAQSTL